MASHKNLFIFEHLESNVPQKKNCKMLDLWNLQNICALKNCTIIVKLFLKCPVCHYSNGATFKYSIKAVKGSN